MVNPFYHFLGKSAAQVAIRWLLQKHIVSSVIIGATTPEQLKDNMGAGAGWKLTKEEVGSGCQTFSSYQGNLLPLYDYFLTSLHPTNLEYTNSFILLLIFRWQNWMRIHCMKSHTHTT